MASEIKVNTIKKASGSSITVGESGDTITVTSGATLSVPSGSTITNAGTATGFKDVDWQSVKTADFTAVAGEGYFVNTTSSAITVTLPASPSLGDIIVIVDYASTFATNNVTLNTNGNKIEAVTNNGVLETNDQTHTLVFTDSTQGWKIINQDTASNIQPAFIDATGGTVTTTGNFKIHTFNSSSNFVVANAGSVSDNNKVSYLVVAGGGGGGGNDGGGGGAGGFRETKSPTAGTYTASPLATTTGLTVSAQTYPITVGAGGTAGTSNANGGTGGSSIFSTITSAGGAGGKSESGTPNVGLNGGSGSGGGAGGGCAGAGGSGNTPPVSPPQGSNGGNAYNPGGAGSTPPCRHGGGGGGATAVGGNASSGSGGNGGAGATTEISNSPLAYSGGGGGGGRSSGGSSGSSLGGGGTDASGPVGGSGTANRGAGGGGSGEGAPGGAGAGGSGVVIIRYKYQ